MKKSIKLFQLLFIIVVSALLVVGCSSGSSNDSTNKTEKNEGGNIKLEVIANINALTKDLEEIPYINDISEEVGVDIDWTYVRSGWEEQKNPILSSGELPDVFIASIDNNDIATYENLFLPLNDLIEEHAPNIQRMFEEMPEVKELATNVNGKIYGLPSVIPHRPKSEVIPMINKVWLDNLGLEVPTTFDEFYEVLKAFKEEDPNGNGEADEIPFDWGPDMGPYSAVSLLGAYGNYTVNSSDWFNVAKDGTHVYIPETDDYRKLVEFLHELYVEGLINQEVFTQDWDQFFARSQNPKAATVGYTIGWSFDQRVGRWEDEYEVISPIAAEEGIDPIWPTDPLGMRTEENRAVVAKDTEHPELVIKWLDSFYSEEASAQGYYGSFGIGVEEKDGEYIVLDPPEDDISPDEWKWTNALVDHGMMYVSEDLDERIIAPKSIQQRLEQDDMLSPYHQPEKDLLPKLKFTEEEESELSIISTDLSNLVEQKWADWVTNGGATEEWDNYLQELKNMGLDRYKEIYQEAYDRQK